MIISIIMKMLCLAIFEMFSIGDCWDALLKMIMMVVIRIIIIKIMIVGIIRFMNINVQLKIIIRIVNMNVQRLEMAIAGTPN